MQKIMKAFRGDVEKFGNKKVLKLLDYAAGLDSFKIRCIEISARRQLLH